MLKFILFLIFMIPILFMNNIWWFVVFILFIFSWLFLLYVPLNFNFVGISYFMGLDVISYVLILLSIWICCLMVMASSSVFNTNYYSAFFLFMIIILLLMLIFTFSSMNLFLFYFFFECSVLPTLFLILGWGYQPERIQAGIYLLFYTLFASLPLLFSIFYLYNSIGMLFMFSFLSFNVYNFFIYLSLILAFLVKMPMFLVHLWLPKAHVEAPVSGSMILAGILLKLGGYGLIRLFPIMINLGIKYNILFISISLFGGFMISLMCLCQTDLKSLIAYSSVAHMGMVLSGIMTLTYWGICGSLILMIAHGLCSSGLFCLANISYERVGSRSLLLNKGLINFMPSMSLWWFMLSSSNMAAPPSLNLLGEISLLNCIVGWSFLSMIMLSLLSFFSACYTLYMYSYSQHGKMYSGMYSSSSGYVREFSLLMLHWVPLNLLILKVDFTMLMI
uniref:NADH-ubiquinone oxidoreductase chain 4 n=1 Tax=Sclerophasma paresisense TaxID=253126 RepID=Q2Q1I7_9NEOP|nr:NADH dehydrogenase subunit 4 [Sclerophasma paresisense]ABB81899.1 NADH dehydrogenase subunit 4 [Sclerophasma paresisense]